MISNLYAYVHAQTFYIGRLIYFQGYLREDMEYELNDSLSSLSSN